MSHFKTSQTEKKNKSFSNGLLNPSDYEKGKLQFNEGTSLLSNFIISPFSKKEART